MENPAKFRLLYLPRIALEEVISMMVPFELINFSKTSRRTEMIARTLPARKRTYEISLKYSLSSNLTVHSSNMHWELIPSEDKKKDGLFEAFYRGFEIPHIKISYENIRRILNCSIKEVRYLLGPVISDHKSMIDWLKSLQKSVKKLEIRSYTPNDDDLKYLLGNLEVTECLILHVDNKIHFDWDILLHKNLVSFHLNAANGINLQQLLRMDSSRITLQNSKLTGIEINLFLKSWMASKSNLNLEFFEINIKHNAMDTVLNLPHREVRYENGKVFGNDRVGVAEIFDGIEIKQSSGKTGVMRTERNGNQMILFLYIY